MRVYLFNVKEGSVLHQVNSKEEKLDTGSPPSHPTKHLPERGLRGGLSLERMLIVNQNFRKFSGHYVMAAGVCVKFRQGVACEAISIVSEAP